MCFVVAMETFAVDKSFYDIDSADELKELWEADLDPVSLSLFIMIMALTGNGNGGFFPLVLNPVAMPSRVRGKIGL